MGSGDVLGAGDCVSGEEGVGCVDGGGKCDEIPGVWSVRYDGSGDCWSIAEFLVVLISDCMNMGGDSEFYQHMHCMEGSDLFNGKKSDGNL